MKRKTLGHIIVLVFLLFVGLKSSAQMLSPLDFPSIEKLRLKEQKNTVVFIGTEWCSFCHKMENTTLQNQEIKGLLSNSFYFTSLNAETKEDITFFGHTFRFQPTGGNTGYHELAQALGTIDGKMNYPTITILNEKNEIIFQYGGLMDSDELKAVLNQLVR